MKLLSIFFIIQVLTGCTYFTRPLDQPVIEHKINSQWLKPGVVGTLSLTPERRTVLVNFDTMKFCAEAPTEVGIDVNQLKSFSASVKKGNDIQAGLNAVIASANNNTVLNKRTQGMQLYLASSYVFCQMYLNDAVGTEEYLSLQKKALDIASPLILNEIKLMYKHNASNPIEYNSRDVQSNPEALKNVQTEKNPEKENKPL